MKIVDIENNDLEVGMKVAYCTADGHLKTGIITKITTASVMVSDGHWTATRKVPYRILKLH